MSQTLSIKSMQTKQSSVTLRSPQPLFPCKKKNDVCNYSNPTALFFGNELSHLIVEAFAKLSLSPQRILIVTGVSAAEEFGFKEELTQALPKNAEVYSFAGVCSDPPVKLIAECTHLINEHDIDLIIGLGGGSVIDFSKACASLQEFNGDVESTLKKRNDLIPKRVVPLLAIPTTAGTGTEATPYAVLRAENNKRLFATSPNFFPTAGLICTKFFTTVPPNVAREVALDGFTHALEALWSNQATPISDGLALHALDLYSNWIVDYCLKPSNPQAANAVAYASTLSGLAFANAFTTICHALSFPIAETLNLSHGKCCGLTIVSVAKFNATIDSPGTQKLNEALGIRASEELPDYLENIRSNIGENDTLSSVGLKASQIESIANAADQTMVKNNMRTATTQDLIRILKDASKLA